MTHKININGVTREMTEEEAAELQKHPAEQDVGAADEVAELRAQVAMLTARLQALAERVGGAGE